MRMRFIFELKKNMKKLTIINRIIVKVSKKLYYILLYKKIHYYHDFDTKYIYYTYMVQFDIELKKYRLLLNYLGTRIMCDVNYF